MRGPSDLDPKCIDRFKLVVYEIECFLRINVIAYIRSESFGTNNHRINCSKKNIEFSNIFYTDNHTIQQSCNIRLSASANSETVNQELEVIRMEKGS